MSTVPQKLGKYELRQSLGRGNIGEVWQGYDLQHKRDVVVKVLHTDLQSDPNFMKRFTTEGQKIASLRHDNIVSVYDVAVAHQEQSTSTTAYIASAFIEGQTLEKYIAGAHKKGTLLSLPDIVYLFTSLGVAIDYAHQKGIVHGNIKPSNILLDQHATEHFAHGEPMLTDFGLPLLLGDTAAIGTPHYMSPEQARGDAPNNRSDIYALGVILYELCTGTKPFRDESSVAVMMQHLNTLPTPPTLINAQLPPALSEVILRAMAKDTATRYAMASLLATAIADACSIRSTIPLHHTVIAEEESAYHAASGKYASFLGVSQPTGPTKPLIQPSPSIYAKPSTPLPAALTSTPSVSDASGKQRVVQPTSAPITKKIATPLPSSTPPTRTAPQLAQTSFTTEKATHSSVVTQAFAPIELSQAQSTTSFPSAARGKRSRITDVPIYAVLAIFAIILLIATVILGSVLLNSKSADSSAVVGHVFFQDDALGHADELRLDIQNVSAPAQNTVYDAWLQDTNHHTLPLGSLTLVNDHATLLYPGNAKHTNLLSMTQGVLVTTENVGQTPSAPTGNMVYKATLDTASFQYVKNILYQTPNFPTDSNNVIVGMFETIKSINDKAGSLVDSIQGTHDNALAKRQATRIIELIDGTQYAKVSGDLPKGMQSEVYARVGLLSSPTQPGYIDTLATQLDKLQQVAPNNTSLQQHIQNVKSALTDLHDWLQKLRTYDVPLVQTAHIANPALTNNALQVRQLASDAYTGRIIPPNSEPSPTLGSAGAYQAYTECQYLATLDIKKIG